MENGNHNKIDVSKKNAMWPLNELFSKKESSFSQNEIPKKLVKIYKKIIAPT